MEEIRAGTIYTEAGSVNVDPTPPRGSRQSNGPERRGHARQMREWSITGAAIVLGGVERFWRICETPLQFLHIKR